MDISKVQEFEWGQIEWMYEPENELYTVMNIGIITIFPRKSQKIHVHYGDEQLIYVLSGIGKQSINGKVSETKEGMIFHMNPGDMHDAENTGDENLVEILISIPVNIEQSNVARQGYVEKVDENVVDGFVENFKLLDIKKEILNLHNNIVKYLKLPISIFDDNGDILLNGDCYPKYCKEMCKIDENVNNCELYNVKDEYKPPFFSEYTSYVCKYGLTVFYLPIIYKKRQMGFIRGGHIRKAEKIIGEKKQDNSQYEMPKSGITSILKLLVKFQRNILEYISFKNAEEELLERDNVIKEIVKNEMELEKSLKEIENKMLNNRINNHFLFNTLSAIAGLAVIDKSYKTYEAIINLSKMFRYSMYNGKLGVSLFEEIEHVNNYLDLQKIRFGDKLLVNFEISSESLEYDVPFNFLQPIVENCFNHGFAKTRKIMKINICTKVEKEQLVISIRDNGTGMGKKETAELVERLNLKKGRFSGLMMIYVKLEKIFGESAKFDIESEINKGTTIKISIPSNEIREKLKKEEGNND